MDCSTPVHGVGVVLHQLPVLAKTHVRRVSDAIQPSHLQILIPGSIGNSKLKTKQKKKHSPREMYASKRTEQTNKSKAL